MAILAPDSLVLPLATEAPSLMDDMPVLKRSKVEYSDSINDSSMLLDLSVPTLSYAKIVSQSNTAQELCWDQVMDVANKALEDIASHHAAIVPDVFDEDNVFDAPLESSIVLSSFAAFHE